MLGQYLLGSMKLNVTRWHGLPVITAEITGSSLWLNEKIMTVSQENTDPANQNDIAIDCQGLWKIFGKNSAEAMKAIQTDNLSKTEIHENYDCIVGVKDATFSVRRGEIFCIMGLSGSGKSTLIRHINRLIEPTAGKIFISNQDVNALSNSKLREMRADKIGMVFQNMALMPHKSVIDNVAFSLEVRGYKIKERREIAMRAIKSVELDGWEHDYPDQLSGGMQQRVGLARAIAADPEILLMDEPFSALDPLIRRQLQNRFMALSAQMNKTTVFITHDLDEAIRIGDRIAIMKDGVLVQIGTPEDIVTNPIDDYVADFVAGISKLHLISAAKIMQPIEQYEKEHGKIDPENCVQCSAQQSLDDLINLSVSTESPLIINDNNKQVGVIGKNILLRAVRGDTGNQSDAKKSA